MIDEHMHGLWSLQNFCLIYFTLLQLKYQAWSTLYRAGTSPHILKQMRFGEIFGLAWGAAHAARTILFRQILQQRFEYFDQSIQVVLVVSPGVDGA